MEGSLTIPTKKTTHTRVKLNDGNTRSSSSTGAGRGRYLYPHYIALGALNHNLLYTYRSFDFILYFCNAEAYFSIFVREIKRYMIYMIE